MQELTTTRHNELIEPFLQIWNWQIPVYLFLGGLVAGLMIISGYSLLKGRFKENDCSCVYLPLVSIILLSLGMLALFLDLEHKLFVWRLYTAFRITSPMSWGAWILIAVYVALLSNFLINPPLLLKALSPRLQAVSEEFQSSEKVVKGVATGSILLGTLLGIYTGILLSSLGARPLWNSSSLWLLFLVSGLSSASAFVHLISKNAEEKHFLLKADSALLIAELFVIFMVILGLLSSDRAHIEAVSLILTGKYAAVFWVFVVGLGIVIPLLLQLLTLKSKVRHSVIPALMVIFGGLLLRFVIVYAGQYSHYLNAHFK
ncbi:MAG: NrfD/PsrC family molybdoenzyme membrane anchor subunit [Syntrophomonadaceae bacterium]